MRSEKPSKRKACVDGRVGARWWEENSDPVQLELDRAPVADKLRERGVVAMRADWARADPKITAYPQSFGRYGVPLDVVYGPGAPAGRLARAADTGAVMDAFQGAAAGPTRRQEAAE
jgi:suppressor for copper-sensitivity B